MALVPPNGLFALNQGAAMSQAADVNPTAADLTDNTTGTPSTTLAAGTGQYWLWFPFLAATFANGDMVTNLTLGHKFKILNFVAVCTAAAAASLAAQCDAQVVDVAAVITSLQNSDVMAG